MKWKLLPKFRSRSISKEIFTLVIGVVTIPFVVISLLSYYGSLGAVKKEFQSSSALILNNLSFNIDQYLQGVENATLFAYLDKELQNALDQLIKQPDSYNKLNNQQIIENFIGHLEASVKHINGVQLFTGDRVYYTGVYDLVGADYAYNYREADWYRKTLDSPGGKMLFGTHKPFQRKFSNDLVLSFARVVNHLKDGHFLGIVLVDIRLDSIKEILDLSESDKRNFIITDAQGRIIYASQSDQLKPTSLLGMKPEALNQVLHTSKGQLFTSFAGENVYVDYLTSGYSGWKVIQYMNESDMIRDAVKLKHLFLALAVGSVGVAVVFMIFISMRVSRPIIDLSRKMKLVGQGNFEVDLVTRRSNELGILYAGLRKMITDLELYIERASTAGLKQKEAQYGALKSQINPHFLSNTLESIQMQAVLSDQREIGEMIGVLGRLFKIHTRTGTAVVPLSQELNHIRLYLKLQQMRFGDKIQYREQVEEDCLSLYVVHFLLQPIVENAVIYGMEQQAKPGTILVKAFTKSDRLWIIVEDNGKGMAPDVLEDVRSRLIREDTEPTSEHIGLSNVHDRIRLYFGEQYGITIDSRLGEGTRVTVCLPISPNEPKRVHL